MVKRAHLLKLLLPAILGAGLPALDAFSQNGGKAALVRCGTRRPAPGMTARALASQGGRIFAGLSDGTIEALESGSLEPAWRAELGGDVVSDILLVSSGVAVVTNQATKEPANGDSTLGFISKESGVTIWSAKLPRADAFFLGQMNGGVAALSSSGSLSMVSLSTGKIEWQIGPLGPVTARPGFLPDSVLFSSPEAGGLLNVSASDGSILAKQATEFVPSSILVAAEDEEYAAGDRRGNVTLYGAKNRRSVWRFKSGAGVSSIAQTGQGLIVTSLDNFVYLISDYNGDVIWKRRLTGRVTERGISIGDYLVLLLGADNSIFVIDLKNGKVIDVNSPADREILNGPPVFVDGTSFAFASTEGIELYALGSCGPGNEKAAKGPPRSLN